MTPSLDVLMTSSASVLEESTLSISACGGTNIFLEHCGSN